METTKFINSTDIRITVVCTASWPDEGEDMANDEVGYIRRTFTHALQGTGYTDTSGEIKEDSDNVKVMHALFRHLGWGTELIDDGEVLYRLAVCDNHALFLHFCRGDCEPIVFSAYHNHFSM